MNGKYAEVDVYGRRYCLMRRQSQVMLVHVKADVQSIEAGYRQLSVKQTGSALAGGRGEVKIFQAGESMRAACRNYCRGGFVRHFVSESFIGLPPFSLESTRSFRELEVLSYLLSKGVPVVRPLAAVASFRSLGLVYSASLLTQYEEESDSLFNLFRYSAPGIVADETSGGRLAFRAGRLAGRILTAGVYHPDLHPGNLILTANDELKALDFDKAFIMHEPSGRRYAAALAERWRRSISKYNFPQLLAEQFEAGLRS
ncbi:MAG: lipopolysaccharide kinase InaA family protein [bacterium]|nr:lipopolysaccharide kinase InaA family protein [bacterium]